MLLLILIALPGLANITLSGDAPRTNRAAGSNSFALGRRWSSGWVDIAPGETITFTHNLGGEPEQYAVGVWFRDTHVAGLGIHHRGYGGADVAGRQSGAYWHNLTGSTVGLTRRPDDVRVAQVRVLIFIPKRRDYDSGWQKIRPGQTITFTHNLGGNADDYTAGIEFYDSDPHGLGIHQFAAGGLEHGGTWEGVAFQALTSASVQVFRFPDDVHADRVRMFVSRPTSPAMYDSGWRDIAAGRPLTLTHNLGGNPNGYIVRALYRSAALGVNERAGGGLEAGGRYFGANIQNLTTRQVTVFRQPDDPYAEQVRVRLWRLGQNARPASLTMVAPPAGVAVPVGQYIGVCYYFEGEAPAVVELTADGEEVVREVMQPGQKVTHAWSPAEAGAHRLDVRVLAPDGTVQASSTLNVTGLAGGERVHVRRFGFRFTWPWFGQ
jgi:hypothetical protein